MDPREGATVLIVEDERELADAYARWLDGAYTVHTAYTGEEALELIDESVDVVLLDRRLPGMAGKEVLEELRGRDLECRVGMLTAVDPDFDIFEMDFDDYVIKPVLKDELHGIVERLLKLAVCDEQFGESFALASKLRVLEEEKTRKELVASDEYVAAKERLDALRDRIDTTLAEFEEADFETAYRTLVGEAESEPGTETGTGTGS